ncbi:unnamed protein product [Rhodiola kirilowii]
MPVPLRQKFLDVLWLKCVSMYILLSNFPVQGHPMNNDKTTDEGFSHRGKNFATHTTARTETPISPHSQPTDYIPHPVTYPDINRVINTTTSLTRAPRHPHMDHDPFPLDDDPLMMNISPLFRNNSQGLPIQPDGEQPAAVHMDDASQLRSAPRDSPTGSRPSVDRPSPRSQPYPRLSPNRHNVRGETTGGTSSRMLVEEGHKVLIRPRYPNRFVPAKHRIDIGFQCMGKHWVAGWTTVDHIPQWGKDQWFEEFKLLATWDANHTADIKSIFFEKCRTKLNNGWYNVRHSRSKEGLKFLKRHEVDAGLVWYAINADKIQQISERNKVNSKDIEARTHRGGPKGTDVHYGELEIELGRKVYCHDMWERLKKKPGGTYVSDAAAEKAVLLEKAHGDLKEKYGDSIPHAMDFEVGSQIIGYNKRTKLPNIIGTAATLFEGFKFNRIASLHIGSSSATPCPQLDVVSEQMTQLQQQHQQMMQILLQQQQLIMNLTQEKFKASTSQPQHPEQDEDIESTD